MDNKYRIAIIIVLSVLIYANIFVVYAQQEVLVYHVYYNDVLIMQMEVIPTSAEDIRVKIVPLYDIDSRTFYAISDLLVAPTKYRFILKDLNYLLEKTNARVEVKDNVTILEYKVDNFMRKSIYDRSMGVLLRESNIYDDINITVSLITVIGTWLYYNTITATIPLVILILGLAVYSYVRRENIRIL